MKKVILLLSTIFGASLIAQNSYSCNEGNTDISKGINLPYDKSGYFLLPDDLQSGLYDYAIGWPIFEKGNLVRYYWDSWLIDGRYYLRFSPKQMVLFSYHENPNPNHIEWVANISEEQFEALKKIPEFKYKWLSDKDSENSLAYKNLKRLLTQINKQMGNLKFQIPSKKEFDNRHRVLLYPGLDK